MSGTQVLAVSSEADFNQLTSSLPSSCLQVIYFHAPWAEPCKQMSTVISTLASTYPTATPPTIAFLSLDAEEVSEVSEAYDVTQVPYIVLSREGSVLETISGGEASRVRAAVEKHSGSGSTSTSLPPLQQVTRPPPSDKPSADLSTYAPSSSDPATAPQFSSSAVPDGPDPAAQKEKLNARLAELVKAAPVMLFMKGTPSAPQCGFSRQTVSMLREKGVRYGFFNILADDDVRQGLKEYSEWPTFPQVYVGGELVGGLDILKEEFENDPDFLSDYIVSKPSVAA